MSSKLTKFVLNYAGVGELLTGAPMQGVVDDAGAAFAASCGDGYATRSTMTNRAGCNVFAETDEAKADNLENNTLEKAIAPYRRS